MERPNIFNYATSELSQDAFIAWLLSWAQPDLIKCDRELHVIALEFLSKLTDLQEDNVKKIEVKVHERHTDVCAKINDNLFIIIEDKTGTSEHDNQIERYKDNAKEDFLESNIICCYLKTQNESLDKLEDLKKKGYNVILRKDILEVLRKYKGSNEILVDFRNNLERIDSETNSFMNREMKDWGWYAWQGFYTFLQKKYTDMHWDYVPNASGGFLGCWWHWQANKEVEAYLQFEEAKLCFKINCLDANKRKEMRDKYHLKLMQNFQQDFPEINRPTRLGIGTYMTIGVVDYSCFLSDKNFNWDSLIDHIDKYQKIVDELVKL